MYVPGRKVKYVLVIYDDINQNLPKVANSVLQYFWRCKIKTLKFVNINDLTEDKAKELMPILHTTRWGNLVEECRLRPDMIVFCAETKAVRKHTVDVLKLVVPYISVVPHILYSSIRRRVKDYENFFD